MSAENSDWLGNLPDALLIDILSRLEATEVVQTCILSKRWVKLWTFVPRLCFNYSEFKGEETSENAGRDLESFENFVSTFLSLRDDATNVDSFTLDHILYDSYPKVLPDCVVGRWILYASTHNPKELHIDLYAKDFIHLPDSLFTCESLEDLHLVLAIGTRYDKGEIKPHNVCLPRLRKLYISYASFDGEYMKKLLVGCPTLESLSMDDCALKMKNISFQNIKKLAIRDCYFVGDVSLPTYPISAPGLEYLYFEGKIGTGVKLEDMYSLTEANITTNYGYKASDYKLDLLSSFYGVETMKLRCFPFYETLEAELSRCLTFNNLKNLWLGEACMYCNFGLLSSFLRRCPNLEDLTLLLPRIGCQYYSPDEHELYQGQNTEQFDCKLLKKIKVLYSSLSRCYVDQLVQLLLRRTLEIEGIEIIT